jgi:hypothetical protein
MSEPQLHLRRRLLSVSPWLRETEFLCELRELWGSGLATPCGVLSPLSHVVRSRLKDGDASGLADLFGFLDTLLAWDAETPRFTEVQDAVATCFFENIVEPDQAINGLYSPLLGSSARAYIGRYWPECLAARAGPTALTG